MPEPYDNRVERQQDRDIAALLESNRAIQQTLETFARAIERIEKTMDERSFEAHREREAIVVRLAKVEAENTLLKAIAGAIGVAAASAIVMSVWQLITNSGV